MRKQAGSWIIKILFGIIVVVFVFFYGFSDLEEKGGQSTIASVGKRKISMNEYMLSYRNMLQVYRSLYKNQFSDEMIEKLGLKQKVLEEMMDREVLLQEADRRHIVVTPEEVQKAIFATPMFQENGVFSERLYQRALSYFNLSAADYEREKERELVLKNLQEIITQTAVVSEKEVRDMFLLQNEKVKIAYVTVEPGSVKEAPAVSEDEIKEYYEKHKEEYKIPEQVKVQYVAFDPGSLENSVDVTPKEIKEIYDTETDRYAVPRKVKARHILFKIDQKATEEQAERIKKKAENVLEEVRKGGDFGKLAKKYSEDTASAEKGGDLGYFKKGDMVKPFEEAAFSLKPGEVGPLVKSQFGFHILQVIDLQDARVKTLDEVKDEIEQEIRKEKAQDLAGQEAKQAFNRLYKNKRIADYAQEKGFKTITTDYFSYGQSPEDMPGKEVFSKEAFALAPGEISPSFAVGQKYFLLKLEDKRQTRIPPVEDVKAEIIRELEKQKKMMLADETAKQLLALLEEGKEQWESLAKKNNLEIKEAEVRRTGEYIPGIGAAKALKNAVFALTPDKPYAPGVYQGDKGMLIVRLREKVEPTEAAFSKEKDKIAQGLMQNKQQELFQQFLQQLKAGAEIWVNNKIVSSL